jgi:hypothetical protein
MHIITCSISKPQALVVMHPHLAFPLLHCAHRSSEVYDGNGHYIPGHFEELWEAYDPGHTGRLGLVAVLALVWDNASTSDPLGRWVTAGKGGSVHCWGGGGMCSD